MLCCFVHRVVHLGRGGVASRSLSILPCFEEVATDSSDPQEHKRILDRYGVLFSVHSHIDMKQLGWTNVRNPQMRGGKTVWRKCHDITPQDSMNSSDSIPSKAIVKQSPHTDGVSIFDDSTWHVPRFVELVNERPYSPGEKMTSLVDIAGFIENAPEDFKNMLKSRVILKKSNDLSNDFFCFKRQGVETYARENDLDLLDPRFALCIDASDYTTVVCDQKSFLHGRYYMDSREVPSGQTFRRWWN